MRSSDGSSAEGARQKALEVLNIKVLDPACGSGSFLLAAFDYLMNYCIAYVTKHPDAAAVPMTAKSRTRTRSIAMRDSEGEWRLTPDFKGEILGSCIYGVDIDPQAVEVTIMSLYLKVLENLPVEWQRELWANRLLPPLDNNIRCGNSLLSPADFDVYWDATQATLFERQEDVRFRMNPFEWRSETHGFGRLLNGRRGFDCIVGNPPYIRVQELNKWAPEECEFYKWQYRTVANGNFDIYVIFLARSLELLGTDGLLGFICPNKFWQANYGAGIRRMIGDGTKLLGIINFTDQQVFREVTTYTAIHILSQSANAGAVAYAEVTDLIDGELQCGAIDANVSTDGVSSFSAKHPLGNHPWSFATVEREQLCERLEQAGPALNAVAEVFVGVQTSADDIYHLDVLQKTQSRTTCDVGSMIRIVTWRMIYSGR